MLPTRPGAAPALRRAGADKIALHVCQSAKDSNHKRPVLVAVSAHGSARERNCPPASTMRLTMANRSKVERARRSIRVTVGHIFCKP
jgi:hypothetical protein